MSDSARILTDEIGRVVVRGDGETNVVEEVDHLVDVAEVRGLAVAQQQQLVEHVEDLRGGLVDRDDQRLALLLRVPLEARHEHVGRVGVQARGRLLRETSPVRKVAEERFSRVENGHGYSRLAA